MQELEQLGAVLRDLSPTLAAFHTNLVDAGFIRREALELTAVLFRHLLEQGRRKE